MTDAKRSRFLELFKARALSFGDFVLASGRRSSYYLNSKKVLFHSESAALLADLLYEATADLNLDAAGGLEVGAIPLATMLVMRSHAAGRPLEGFFVRKAVKEHGSRERIEGVLKAGDRVAVLDDVLTTGGSAAEAVSAVEAAGAKVAAVVCIVDRLGGARERLAGYEYRPLFTTRDFGIEPT